MREKADAGGARLTWRMLAWLTESVTCPLIRRLHSCRDALSGMWKSVERLRGRFGWKAGNALEAREVSTAGRYPE